jgi:hypothetical protein
MRVMCLLFAMKEFSKCFLEKSQRFSERQLG